MSGALVVIRALELSTRQANIRLPGGFAPNNFTHRIAQLLAVAQVIHANDLVRELVRLCIVYTNDDGDNAQWRPQCALFKKNPKGQDPSGLDAAAVQRMLDSLSS